MKKENMRVKLTSGLMQYVKEAAFKGDQEMTPAEYVASLIAKDHKIFISSHATFIGLRNVK